MNNKLIVLIGLITVFGMNSVVGQSAHNCDSHTYSDFELLKCRERGEDQLLEYLKNIDYQTYFLSKYGLSVSRFSELNQIHAGVIKKKIIDGLCEKSIQLEDVVNHIDSLISFYENDIWLEEPQNQNPNVIHVGKYYNIPQENLESNESYGTRAEGEPCNNPNFETCDYTGWETFCGNVNNSPFQIVNINTCTPTTTGSSQHLIVTGGTDPIVPISLNNPELGSCIARVGDGTGTGNGAAILRQTFLVDVSATILIYRYAAILQNGGTSHSINDQAFVRVRLFDESNQSISCAEYEAYAGDGQTGWLTSGAVEYRDWTTVFTSLEDYVGQNVTMEFAVGDCAQGGHYGYAYVDAECGILEIEAYCEGQSTILRAPDGAAAYLWSTGEITQEISINTAGHYTCEVTPVQGVSCNVLVEIDIEPFPVPQPDFLATPIEICPGDQIQFSDETLIATGGVITTYQWDFGDGIETPHSNGAIVGVSQTTGTYTSANHQYLNSGVYDVELTVYSADGCYNSSTSQVTVKPLPTATISGSASTCLNDTEPQVTFTGANGISPYTFTYNVNGGVNQVITTQVGNDNVNIGASTDQVGNFDYNLVSVVDAFGCFQNQVGTITVEVISLPTASITGTTQVCLNDPQPIVTFEGQNGVEPYTFTYSLNGGADQTISTTGGNTATIVVPTNVSGNVVVNLLGVQESSPLICGQNQVGSVTVTVHSLPIVSAGNDIAVCEGYTVVLTGSGASTYVWDNGAINGQSFVPTTSGTYTVIGTDNNGCQNSDQMDIIWTPTPQVSFVGDVLDGCLPVVTEFAANTTGNIASCLWNFGDGSTSSDCNNVTHSFNGAGCYTVSYTVTTIEGCTNTQTIPQYVCAYPYPIADFTPVPAILSTLMWESQMENESAGASSYHWDFGDGSAYSTEISPIHEFPSDEGGSYLVTLIAYTSFGCPDTISQLVVVNEEPIYYVPNTFTPDNDSYNEVFKPIFTFGFDPFNFNMLIFNRWGEVLFESNDAEVGWDGTYGGKLAQDGVYIWKITFKVKDNDKRHTITGHVNLIR